MHMLLCRDCFRILTGALAYGIPRNASALRERLEDPTTVPFLMLAVGAEVDDANASTTGLASEASARSAPRARRAVTPGMVLKPNLSVARGK